jgi:hypothetical protein
MQNKLTYTFLRIETTLYTHLFFFLVLSFGRQKKVPKKNRPKIQPNDFVTRMPYAT